MSYRPETRSVHVKAPELGASRPLGVPLYQNAVFGFDDPGTLAEAMSGPEPPFAYAGYANPTVRALEDAVAGLEEGAAALGTSTGMAAITSVFFSELGQGDHVIAQRRLYGGTVGLLRELSERWGLSVTYVSGDDPQEIREAVRPNSRLLYLETIANPTGEVPDLPALTAVAKDAGLVTVVDSTFATPLLCRPLTHGADVVVHSATKYLGGHHDVQGGIAVFADNERYRATWSQAIRLGAIADPFSSWLVIRGLKTLPLRIRQSTETATFLARKLEEHPAVRAVHYPGLASHPSHAVAARLLSGFGGIVAFDLASREAADAFTGVLELVTRAGSLGGTETVISSPPATSHRYLMPDELRAAGISEGTLRMAAGLEHAEDLYADIERALEKAA